MKTVTHTEYDTVTCRSMKDTLHYANTPETFKMYGSKVYRSIIN